MIVLPYKNKKKEDVNRLIISPASFSENDSSKVWIVSYDLLKGVATIDDEKVKVTGNNVMLRNVPQPVFLYFDNESFNSSSEIVKEGFFNEKLIEKVKFIFERNYLTIDRHGSQGSDFTFVKVVSEIDEDVSDGGENWVVFTKETRKISTGFCM